MAKVNNPDNKELAKVGNVKGGSADRESTAIRKAAMLQAMSDSLGVVTDAAKIAGVSRETHRLWMAHDKEYADAVANIKTQVHDFGVSCLHKSMKKGNVTAIIFYLKTQCKHLGYVERTEHIVETTESLANRIDYTQAEQLLAKAGIAATPKDADLAADE